MKNLKRALSFALATVMLIGMMVVGASAASFGDADEIVNTDAVNTMVQLGIIKGKDNGNFDPEGIVTRAEMAKMICVALNGGKDPNLSGGGMYADTKGHWAAGYIDYCTNMGIVSGDTAGNFNPDKTVTGTEAAKMMLIALGYNAKTEKFVNDANWSININVIASTRGLYEDVPSLPDAGLTRDNAAQLIFNGIQANMVEYKLVGIVDGTGVSQASEIGKTILSQKFGTMDIDDAVMTKYEYSASKNLYTYTIGGEEYKTEDDFTGLFQQKVHVIAKATDKVYGMYAVDSTVLAEGYSDDIGDISTANKTVEIAGTTYKVENTTIPAVYFKTGATAGNLSAVTPALYTFQLIDNTDNGKADVLVVIPFTLAKVTYVGASSVTFDNGLGNYKLDDIVIYDGVAKNDHVIMIPGDYTTSGDDTFIEAEVKTGTITGFKSGKYLVDGTWMKDATKTLANDSSSVNSDIEYIAFGDTMRYVKVTEGAKSLEDILVVLGTKETKASATSSAKWEANALFADGTKTMITTVDKDGDPTAATAGKMYTFEIDNDGKYVLTEVSGTNDAGYDAFGTGLKDKNGATSGDIASAAGYPIDDDAVVFLYEAGTPGKGKVYTGKDLKSLSSASYTSNYVLASKVDGFMSANVILAAGTIPDSVGVADNYGYLTADSYNTKEGTTKYRNFTIWTADGELTVREETSSTTELKAGTLVEFSTVDANTVKNVAAASGVVTAAVTGYRESKGELQMSGTSTVFEIADDTTILYIDSSKKEGVEGGKISIADEPVSGAYTNNVRYIVGTSPELALLVVDVNNSMTSIASAAGVTTMNSTTSMKDCDLYKEYKSNIENVEAWASYAWFLDLIDSDFVTYGATVTKTGDNALKVTGALNVVSKDAKVPGFGAPATLKDTYGDKAGFAFVALQDDSQIMIVKLEAGTNVSAKSVTIGGTTYTVDFSGMTGLTWGA